MLEFKIVAVDVDNNQKKVTVVIDPKKIMQDKDVFKKIKKANKIQVLSISQLMAEAIKRISNSTSVSDLFN